MLMHFPNYGTQIDDDDDGLPVPFSLCPYFMQSNHFEHGFPQLLLRFIIC